MTVIYQVRDPRVLRQYREAERVCQLLRQAFAELSRQCRAPLRGRK